MSVTPERKESMALTDKYLNNKIVLMTLKTSSTDVTDASQLANLKIGTQADPQLGNAEIPMKLMISFKA